MAIVYQHRKLDTNEIFYIGIGKLMKRAYSKHHRNKWWKNIVNKHDYKVEILYENVTWEEACNIEINLIKEYGRKDLGLGSLCNLTNGGEGVLGLIFKHSEESKLKISNFQKGKIVSEETRKKLSLINLGNQNCKGKITSEETKLKISKSNIGKPKKGKQIIDLNTNLIYNSITIVANKFNIKNRTLANYLSGVRKNKTSFRYYNNIN